VVLCLLHRARRRFVEQRALRNERKRQREQMVLEAFNSERRRAELEAKQTNSARRAAAASPSSVGRPHIMQPGC
jgi:hypothetical protein